MLAAQKYPDKIVILHTNDTHSQIEPLPPSDKKAPDMGGVVRRKALIDSVRQAEKNVLLVDAGDVLQGTPYFTIYKGEVEMMAMNKLSDNLMEIHATIYCERAAHKGIIIGKNGQMLKKISSDARKDCERFMGTKVFLQTWVRVKENWRDSDFMISNFGYHKD